MRTNTAEERPELRPTSSLTVAAWDNTCLGCETLLVGPFCSNCGQRAVPPSPTLRELGGEAFSEFSGWDGKFAETIRTLIRHPGQLTLEFLRGKRSRYISPLRLYLSCSVAYFVLAAAYHSPVTRTAVAVTVSDSKSAPTQVDLAKKTAGLTTEDREAIRASINSMPRLLRPVAQRVANDPQGFQNDIFNALPKGLFVLLPAFAGILKLLYRKRHFAEHLYFSLHLYAFAFLVLSVTALVKWVPSAAVIAVAGIAVLLWVPAYTHLALRRVYGGSFSATLLKELAMSVLYSVASIPVLLALAIWVSRA